MRRRHHWIAPVVSLVLLGLAIWVLYNTLRKLDIEDILEEFSRLPASAWFMAIGLTLVSYVLLVGYDLLALHHIKRKVRLLRVAVTSFISYVFSHNLGMSLLTGGGVRYRLYSPAGLSPFEVAVVTLMCGITFVVGAMTLSGVALLLEPLDVFVNVGVPHSVIQLAGVMLLATVGGYAVIGCFRRRPLTFRGLSLGIPMPWLTTAQIVLACADIALAAAVGYVLIAPSVEISFAQYLGIYVISTAAGIASHVPGGLGVFEAGLLLMLPEAPIDVVLAAALAYRLVYLLGPLAFAATFLGGYELAEHGGFLPRGNRKDAVHLPADNDRP